MLLFKSLLLALLVVLVVFGGVDAKSFLERFKLHKNSNPECKRVIQDSVKCVESQAKCRGCCHFDVMKLNDLRAHSKSFYIKEALLVSRSGECVCELCEKHLEDFNNPAWF